MTRTGTLALVALASVGAAGLILVYRYDPATTALFPPCPFHELTGLHCPGCGSTRALHALLHGEVRGAMAFNPLFTLGSPWLLLGTAREAYRLTRGEDRFGFRVPAWSIYSLLMLIVTFGVLRNLPTFWWLAPR